MALFPNVQGDYTFGGKTHTNLVVSEGAAPAEKWIVDKDEKFKFNYAFGPEGNQGVVLAKGKIVELGAAQHDYETNRMVSTIKQATAGSKKAVGVNHHNIYERKRDRFSGNNQPNPVVITRSYIEVPLFEAADATTASQAANAMGYGAAYGDKTNLIQPGDFVKVGENGNFVKLDTATDSPFEIVGQVLAAERELPPAGFLQYYMDMKIDEVEAFFKAKSHAPSPGNNNSDAGAYPYGHAYQNKGWKADFEKLLNPTINKGIPFLTDGYFAAKQVLAGKSMGDLYDGKTNPSGAVENVAVSGQVTVTGADAVVAEGSRNNALFIKLRNEIDRVEADKLVVRYTDNSDAEFPMVSTFTGQDLHIDFTNNTVVVYLEAGKTYTGIELDVPSVVDPIAGMPTEWDHAGSVGAVRILLQR